MSDRAKGWVLALSMSLGFYSVTVGGLYLTMQGMGWL